jgi:hypothetical protein
MPVGPVNEDQVIGIEIVVLRDFVDEIALRETNRDNVPAGVILVIGAAPEHLEQVIGARPEGFEGSQGGQKCQRYSHFHSFFVDLNCNGPPLFCD